MRHAMNFRFKPDTIVTLQQLEELLHISKTAVLEEALRLYAKKKLAVTQTLLQFAGKISKKDSNDMLKSIKSSRKNKNKLIEL